MRYREFTVSELKEIYWPNEVTDYGDSVIVKNHDAFNGPTLLEFPKALPVDSNNRIIDPSQTFFDHDNRTCTIFGTNFDGEIFVRLGQSTIVNCQNPSASGQAICRLRLGDIPNADTIQLIVYRHQAPALIGPLQPIIPPELQPLILSRDTADLDGRTFIDFWLIKFPAQPSADLIDFRNYCHELYQERIKSLS